VDISGKIRIPETNILLSMLTPKAQEIIGDHQCGF
jgi:hypothetical protein